MDAFNGPNGFVGREAICRPIQFERYRKPLVTNYPRRAIVLNPRHAKEQFGKIEAGRQSGNVSSSDCGNSMGEEGTDNSDDDDDPLNLEDEVMLCRNEQLRHLLNLRWLSIGPNGCGLQNMGNTCFVNSVLQALAYTPALAQYFADNFKSLSSHLVGAPYDYAYALGETVRKIHATSNGIYRPSHIVSNLSSLSPQFRLGSQGDAHEFLLELLHACHRSILFRTVGSRKVAHHIEQTTALQRIVNGYLRSVVAWSKQEEIDRLKIAGKLQEAGDLGISSSERNSGTLLSSTYDPFVTLSVDVVGQTLEHCLANLCEEERLDGRSYVSPRGVGVRATKRFQLHKLPPVIIIHLKRFSCRGGKVGRYIQYPTVLDLAPFCTSKGLLKLRSCRSGDECDGFVKNTFSCLYELNAVCVHEGGSLNYGHYYSFVRARNGTWLLCNDSRVSYCDEQNALGQQAYMLFYSFVEPSSSSAVSAKQARTHVSKEPSTMHRLTAKKETVTFGHFAKKDADEEEENELGRQLDDEEVEKILKKRKTSERRLQHEMGSTEASSHGTTNGHGGAAANSLGDEIESSETDSNSEYNVLPAPASAEEEKKLQAGGKNTALKFSRYGGIVKALTRAAQPAMTGASGLANGENNAVFGHHAVTALEEMRRQCIPATAVRPKHAPKFRQRVRDPRWESEMDRGRVKHVRQKKEEHSGENKFQNAKVKFDIRGRRCHCTE